VKNWKGTQKISAGIQCEKSANGMTVSDRTHHMNVQQEGMHRILRTKTGTLESNKKQEAGVQSRRSFLE
jgi:hypothetical protein